MDVFQLIGDFLHLIAILMLLLKILANKNVIGLSYKTQELYLVVFITRYSDMILEHHWGSLYFNAMRILFLAITGYTIYVMRFKRPYRMVAPSLSRATTQNRTPSRTGRFTSPPPSSPSSSTNRLRSMAFSSLFRFGWRRGLSCRSCT
jgi:ER lumen protein retaining receptor